MTYLPQWRRQADANGGTNTLPFRAVTLELGKPSVPEQSCNTFTGEAFPFRAATLTHLSLCGLVLCGLFLFKTSHMTLGGTRMCILKALADAPLHGGLLVHRLGYRNFQKVPTLILEAAYTFSAAVSEHCVKLAFQVRQRRNHQRIRSPACFSTMEYNGFFQKPGEDLNSLLAFLRLLLLGCLGNSPEMQGVLFLPKTLIFISFLTEFSQNFSTKTPLFSTQATIN